jgi:hypothetical protein
MSEKAIEAISEVGDWYVIDKGTYIRVFRAIKAPHVLPKFISDKLALQEVAYQTFVHGVGASLARDKKSLWPPLPFHVGSYGFKDVKEAVAKAEILVTFHFGEERLR